MDSKGARQIMTSLVCNYFVNAPIVENADECLRSEAVCFAKHDVTCVLLMTMRTRPYHIVETLELRVHL